MDRLSQSNFGKRYATAATRHTLCSPPRGAWLRSAAAGAPAQKHTKQEQQPRAMSVPEAVFVAAGYSAAEAKKVKKAFDSQDIQLQHLTNGDVTQVPLHRAASPSTRSDSASVSQRRRGWPRACTRCALTRRACSPTCRPNQRSRRARTRPLAAVLTRACAGHAPRRIWDRPAWKAP